jgi:hypothetical protein
MSEYCTAEHLRPRSEGGTDGPDNIVAAWLRDEFLNVNEFTTMHDAREKLRRHSTLGYVSPIEFEKAQEA